MAVALRTLVPWNLGSQERGKGSIQKGNHKKGKGKNGHETSQREREMEEGKVALRC